MAEHAAATLTKAKKAVHLSILGIIDTDTVAVFIRETLLAKKAAEQGPPAEPPRLCLYPVFDRSPLDLHKDFDLILAYVSPTDPSPNSFKALANSLRDKYRPQYAAASLVHTDDRALNEMAADSMRAKVLSLMEAEDKFHKERVRFENDLMHRNDHKFSLDEAERMHGTPNEKGESQMKRLKTMYLNAQKTQTETMEKVKGLFIPLDVQLTSILTHYMIPRALPPAMAQAPLPVLPSAQPIVRFTPEALKQVEAEHGAALSAKLLDEQARADANRGLVDAAAAFEKARKALEEKKQAYSEADRISRLSAREESAVSDRHMQLLMHKRRIEGAGRD
jgi:hypothetical protein